MHSRQLFDSGRTEAKMKQSLEADLQTTQSIESSLETNSALDTSKSKEPIPASSNIISSGDALSVNGHIAKSVLPLENVVVSGVHSRKLENDENGSVVLRLDIDMPLADLWTDPCNASAIQTLTGIPCDTKKIFESNNGKAPVI
ncbi:hypothetical protein V6N11_077670 [Hibiscus sabdariffa]|uniref:Uncharacterized protein n=1 Tax=Hibiscus sabdariffa TaxID=183260 RepID=A0ABR2TDR4_9ROSI